MIDLAILPNSVGRHLLGLGVAARHDLRLLDQFLHRLAFGHSFRAEGDPDVQPGLAESTHGSSPSCPG